MLHDCRKLQEFFKFYKKVEHKLELIPKSAQVSNHCKTTFLSGIISNEQLVRVRRFYLFVCIQEETKFTYATTPYRADTNR